MQRIGLRHAWSSVAGICRHSKAQSRIRHLTTGTSRSSIPSASLRGRYALTAGAVVLTSVLLLYQKDSVLQLESNEDPQRRQIKNNSTDAQDVSVRLQTNESSGADDRSGLGTYLTMAEVGRHNKEDDVWVVINGKVYDVTNFHQNHPGGSEPIVSNAGKDVTQLFRSIHPPNTIESHLAPENLKGSIDPKEAAKSIKAYEEQQRKVDRAREELPPVETLLSLDELQEAAEKVMSPQALHYYGGAALDGLTMAANRSSFHKCRFLPKVLMDVSSVSPQTTLFGVASPLPIYISPAANALVGHPEGEMTLVRGAAHTGVIQGISAAAALPLGDMIAEKDKLASNGEIVNQLYQIYTSKDRSKTEAIIREAVDGGVKALLLTVDTPVLGNRQTTDKAKGTKGDIRPGVRMEPFENDYHPYHDPSFAWEDLAWLKEQARGVPIYLKGVCRTDDLRRAREHGLAGVILSNHGGRQLDQARTGFDSLRAIHAEDPQLLKDLEVYVDGGARRGSDVLQAIAFGAKGVGFGRSFLWAQAAYGEEGVIRAVRILEGEIVMAMRLLGAKSLKDITPDMVECLHAVWK